MKLIIRLSALATLVVMALVHCGGSEGSAGCSVDTECATGLICLEGACQAQGCAGPADCYEGQTCVDVNGDGAKECTAVECSTDADCADKGVEDGLEYICTFGACLPKGDKPDEDVTDPDAGDTAEPEVEEDTGGPVDPADKLCQPCVGDDECGGEGNMCTPLPEGDFCTTLCTTNNDCETGFLCLQITNEAKQCVPGLYNKCADCLVNGCPLGEYCHQSEGVCKPIAGECQACVQDDECGTGARCYTFAPGVKKCVPECDDAGACPDNSTCATLNGQTGTQDVQACVPNGGACCFGDESVCAPCDCSATPATPYCDEQGNCKACTDDSHCADPAAPICTDGVCGSGGCAAPTPIACTASPSGCCECTNATHCTDPTKPNCDAAAGVCVEGVECTCVEPYPACIVVDGQIMCVECTVDAECDGGCLCDPNQYTCVNPNGGGYCQGATSCSGDCMNNGCDNSAGTYNLECDPTTGCCFDTNGGCDNVTAYCTTAGAECKSLFDILMGGGGGGMPGIPGMEGMPGMGFCSCTMDLMCLAGGFLPPELMGESICCPDGMMCLDPMQIMDLLAGGGAPSTPSTGGGNGFCVDINALLGGFGI